MRIREDAMNFGDVKLGESSHTVTLPRMRSRGLRSIDVDDKLIRDETQPSSLGAFTPNIQVLKLTKMSSLNDARLWKSPSLPTSPIARTFEDSTCRQIPAYLTLQRKGQMKSNLIPARSMSETGDLAEINKIRSILAGLDLSKYKRRGNAQDPSIMTSPLLDQPKPFARREVVSPLYDIPPPPSAKIDIQGTTNSKFLLEYRIKSPVDRSSAANYLSDNVEGPKAMSPVNSNLKKLTEKLISSSAPSSPQKKSKLVAPSTAPPASGISFWKDPLPTIQQMSFTYDDFEDIRKSRMEQTIHDMKDTKASKPVATEFGTLPRRNAQSSLARLKNQLSKTLNTYYNLDSIHSGGSPTITCDFSRNPAFKTNLSQANRDTGGLSHFSSSFLKHNAFSQDLLSGALNQCPVSFSVKEVETPSASPSITFRTVTPQKINLLPKETKVWGSVDENSKVSEKYSHTSTRPSEQERLIRNHVSKNSEINAKNKDKLITLLNEKKYVPDFAEINGSQAVESKTSISSESSIPLTSFLKTTNAERKESMEETSFSPQQMRFYKKRLRGPYGEMLEQEMNKSKQRSSFSRDSDFLKELDNIVPVKTPSVRPSYLRSISHTDEGPASTVPTLLSDTTNPKRKTSANIPVMKSDLNYSVLSTVPSASGALQEPFIRPRCYSTTVSSSVLATPLTKSWNSEDGALQSIAHYGDRDTRTHVVGELYETEKSYVESLQIVIKKYMKPLKSSDHAGTIDSGQVDEIFYQIPEILGQHEAFLEVLRQRLTNWDTKQKIGDVFVDVFTRQTLIDTYTAYINNWKTAKDTIKFTSAAKPAFGKFLEHTSREHKGKLSLDALLIMPVQRIPRYELLIKELLKHTPVDHPDHRLLLQAQKEVHDLAVNINRLEREALEQEQMLNNLREIEQSIEGLLNLAQSHRSYIRHDYVCIPGGLGIKKDRCLFLFSDLLLITNIKKKGAAPRKTSLSIFQPPGLLDFNKYKLLMRLPLMNVEVTKKVDEKSVKKFIKEVGHLEADVAVLGKISDMLSTLSCQHQILDEAVRDILSVVSKQLIEKQTTNSQLMALDLIVTMQNDMENLTVIFPNPDKRMSWEASFEKAKINLATHCGKLPAPIFLCSIPMRKNHPGLQVTCAQASGINPDSQVPEVWLCNSDNYIGEVSVLSLKREPDIITCNNTCNSKILCILYVPGIITSQQQLRRHSTVLSHFTSFKLEKYDNAASEQFKSFQLDSDTSDDDDFIDIIEEEERENSARQCRDAAFSTMWLGTEDGCIQVYHASDTYLKNARMRMQHSSAVYDLVFVEENIFVALGNGDVLMYKRNQGSGVWDTSGPKKLTIGSSCSPVTKLLLVGSKLWCGSSNNIAVLDINCFDVEHTFQVVSDADLRPVLTMVGTQQGVWIATENSPVIRLFHCSSFHKICDVNIAPVVTKMLSTCDEIIRQHKSACLRVSALHVCKNLLWIGTSAGVLLTLPLLQVTSVTSSSDLQPIISGIPQGHTGHVRLIMSVEAAPVTDTAFENVASTSKGPDVVSTKPKHWNSASVMVICAGDGYEDFNCTEHSETAGQDDSINHLLIWNA